MRKNAAYSDAFVKWCWVRVYVVEEKKNNDTTHRIEAEPSAHGRLDSYSHVMCMRACMCLSTYGKYKSHPWLSCWLSWQPGWLTWFFPIQFCVFFYSIVASPPFFVYLYSLKLDEYESVCVVYILFVLRFIFVCVAICNKNVMALLMTSELNANR